MLTVFWCSTSYIVIIVLWKMLWSLLMHLLVGGPACAWNVFLVGEEKKKIFLRCIYVIELVLKYGSDINEGNWLQLVFYFILLMGIVASVIGLGLFQCVSGFRLKFSRIALLRKRLQLDSKSDLTTNGLILGFFVGKWLPSLTSHLYGLKVARIVQLLFFFDDIKFFRCLVWGVFWSVLSKCLYFWAIGFFNIDW